MILIFICGVLMGAGIILQMLVVCTNISDRIWWMECSAIALSVFGAMGMLIFCALDYIQRLLT